MKIISVPLSVSFVARRTENRIIRLAGASRRLPGIELLLDARHSLLLVLNLPLQAAQRVENFLYLFVEILMLDARDVERSARIAAISPGSTVLPRATI